jgi:alanyl-tRNA synthetase
MTERLYYGDPYRTDFQAEIVEISVIGGRPVVILDGSYFYPTSGGQPYDMGRINGIEVVDVYTRDIGNEILHVLATESRLGPVECEIDWERRFDHMQQHTGQHILSQAFVQVAKAPTLSFHLGLDNCTIDIAGDGMTTQRIAEAEMLANKIVWENRPVRSMFVDQSALDTLPLRKIPEVAGDQLRLIEIDDFDLCACGGTHVSMTGEVGMIKIVKTERRGAELRVEFNCGRRALVDYDEKNAILNRLSADLTTGYSELEISVASMREEAKASRQSLKRQTKRLVALQAGALLQDATLIGSSAIIAQVLMDREPAEIRMLANQIIRSAPSVALLGLAGPKSQLVFASSVDGSIEMGQLLNQVLPELGDATGGGSTTFAQGGGPAVNETTMRAALLGAKALVAESLDVS